MSTIQEEVDPRIVSFCSKYYPNFAKNYRACQRLYWGIMKGKRGKVKQVKIAEVSPDQRVQIEGVVISAYTSNYDGCPDTMKKGACEDGTSGVITVYRFEVADETDSIWVVAFTPAFSDMDEKLSQIEPGDIVRFTGIARERELQDSSKRLEIVVFRNPQAVEVVETKEDRLKEIEEAMGEEQEPEEEEEPVEELVEEDEEETIPEEVEQFLEVLRQLGNIPEKALPKLLDKYGLEMSQVEPYIRVEKGKVYPK